VIAINRSRPAIELESQPHRPGRGPPGSPHSTLPPPEKKKWFFFFSFRHRATGIAKHAAEVPANPQQKT